MNPYTPCFFLAATLAASSALAAESRRVDDALAQGDKLLRGTAGALCTGDDAYYDEYSFSGVAGEYVELMLQGYGFTPRMLLLLPYDSSLPNPGEQLGEHMIGQNPAPLAQTLPYDGRYTIAVSSVEDCASGTYTLTFDLSDSNPNHLTTEDLVAAAGEGLARAAIPISYGETAARELLGYGPISYRFTATAGDEVVATLRSDEFDAKLDLNAGTPLGPLLASDDDGAGEGTNSLIRHSIAESGDYFLTVDSYDGGGQGAFQLSLLLAGSTGNSLLGSALLEAFDEPGEVNFTALAQQRLTWERTAIGYGQSQTGVIDTGDLMQENHHYDAFTFAGRAGDRITATARSDDFDTFLDLNGPATDGSYGPQLAFDDDGGGNGDSRLTHTLPADGNYVLRVLPIIPTQSGAYVIALDSTSSLQSPESSTMSFLDAVHAQMGVAGMPAAAAGNQFLEGELGPGDALFEGFALYDIIPFEGRAGEQVTIRKRSSAFDPMMRLLGPGTGANHGAQIAFNDDEAATGLNDARIDITLPADGTYFVHATVYGNGNGPYTFELTRN